MTAQTTGQRVGQGAGQPTVEIRTFVPAFARDVADMVLRIQREEFGIPITAADQPDLRDIPAFYQSGAGQCWVALVGRRVVGTVALRDIGDRQGALRKMFVHAGWRGKEHGVGQRLLDELLAHARDQGLRRLYIGTTAKFLAAHRFYERNGFHRIGLEELPPRFPRMAVDTRFYVMDLVPGVLPD